MVNKNRVLLSATGSNCGKTMLVSTLLYLLKQKYSDIRGFKCGPDYIDPMYHRKILGIPSKNLDPYFCKEQLLKATFADGAGELNLIEGAMGLYDGMGASSEFSTYQVASTLKCPVVLIVDCSGMGASIMAIIAGFLAMDTQKLIKGIILNRISPGFYGMLRPKIEQGFGVKVLGYLPKISDISLDSRHLGLMSPDETDAMAKIAQVAELMKTTVDLEGLVRIAKDAKKLGNAKTMSDFVKTDLTGITLGVARDKAFSFYYEDNLRALELAGARLVDISPIEDRTIEKGINAIYMGGGYPENYLEELSDNRQFRTAISNFIDSGRPLLAECGAFMYLQEKIEGYTMAGVFDGEAVNMGKLVRFGYIEADYKDYQLKGHEFHYYDVTDPGDEFRIKKTSTGKEYRAMRKKNRCLAGFPHFYFLSDTKFLEVFKL